ncbi:hypothetical protein [Streptomyces sp. WMMB 322]|uniref:hypothetical protein n=1 Tax=Streptomyces sp. WMMB 322 TaxID=1286821 RepID=UPI0006E381E9|nr:hypothetical protein H180DRAFT_00072 [Streptomyces sp. WMMB 322]
MTENSRSRPGTQHQHPNQPQSQSRSGVYGQSQPLPSAVTATATGRGVAAGSTGTGGTTAGSGSGGGARADAPPARSTGSPLIAPGLLPAAVTTALALFVAGAAQIGGAALAVAVALLQAVTAAGWFRLNGMWPARQGIALAFLAGVATDVSLLLADSGHAPAVIIGTLGMWCVLTLVLHLRNLSGPDERLYALTAAFTATALTVIAAGFLASLDAATADAVTAGAAAVAVAALARALPLPPFVSPAVALLAAAGAGIAAGQLTVLGGDGAATAPAAAGGVLGLVTGGCALLGLRVASYDYPSRFVHMTAGVALPLTLAAPVVYLFGRAFV